MARRIEYILAQNQPGRVGTISVRGRLIRGQLLRLGHAPLLIGFAVSNAREGYARSVGQGSLLWQDLDPDCSSLAGLSETLTGGFVAESDCGQIVSEIDCSLEFSARPSVFPWVCTPEQEAEQRLSGLDSATEFVDQQLETGIHYPVECVDENEVGAAGVLILKTLDSGKPSSGILRLVSDINFDLKSNKISITRFGRLIGFARSSG